MEERKKERRKVLNNEEMPFLSPGLVKAKISGLRYLF